MSIICKNIRCTSVKSSNIEIGIDEVPAPPKTLEPLFNWMKSHQAFIQCIVALAILCLPGNLVTLTLYRQVHNSTDVFIQVTKKPEFTLNVISDLFF